MLIHTKLKCVYRYVHVHLHENKIPCKEWFYVTSNKKLKKNNFNIYFSSWQYVPRSTLYILHMSITAWQICAFRNRPNRWNTGTPDACLQTRWVLNLLSIYLSPRGVAILISFSWHINTPQEMSNGYSTKLRKTSLYVVFWSATGGVRPLLRLFLDVRLCLCDSGLFYFISKY